MDVGRLAVTLDSPADDGEATGLSMHKSPLQKRKSKRNRVEIPRLVVLNKIYSYIVIIS